MTKKQALETAMREADREFELKLTLYSSQDIKQRAEEIFSASKDLNKKRNEYNVLSAKNGGTRPKVMTTLNQLTIPVLRDMTVSTASEFLGEEFWLSLRNMNEKLIAKRVFNEIRARLTRGMC